MSSPAYFQALAAAWQGTPPPTPSPDIAWTPKVQTNSFWGGANFGGFLGTTACTLEYWAQTNGQNGQAFRLLPDGAYNRFQAHLPNDGTLYWDCGDITTTGRMQFPFPTTHNEFHHWAFQVDVENDVMAVVLDGQHYYSVPGTSLRTPTANSEIQFGAIDQAQLSEVRYWNRVRSIGEIAQDMNVSIGGPRPGLQFCWRGDEPYTPGGLITDRSGNNRHGFYK